MAQVKIRCRVDQQQHPRSSRQNCAPVSQRVARIAAVYAAHFVSNFPGAAQPVGDLAEQPPAADCLQGPFVPRPGFQWQVKHNIFSRKEGKSSGSNKDLSHNPPFFETMPYVQTALRGLGC